MRKVCIDTNMLIWYIKKECTEGQEDCLEKVEYLFKYFEENEITVVIPSLVVGELLGNVDDEDSRDNIFDFISNNFEIAQHDVLSALKFAELRVKLSNTNAQQYASENSRPKCMMTNDYNICSVALSSGCDAIFSHNLKDFEKFVDHQIPIYTLEYVNVLKSKALLNKKTDPSQGNLFDITTE